MSSFTINMASDGFMRSPVAECTVEAARGTPLAGPANARSNPIKAIPGSTPFAPRRRHRKLLHGGIEVERTSPEVERVRHDCGV